ncbi:TetR/AcrR family transcriptional regulator [Devosia sp.]|uniref:TetR/AcrR family transcriptional regulator n=1 Tax=Devosia sp. TaxID=1871048 RepID=UPI003A949016
MADDTHPKTPLSAAGSALSGTDRAGTDEAAPVQRGPKFRRRAEARPDEVLDAALALFIENGFAATRVDEIARRAGVSKGTLYIYFPSKDAVLEGLVKRALTPLADTAFSSLASFEGDPRVVISTVLKMLAGRLSDPTMLAIPKVILREVAQFPHLAQMYRREVLDRVLPTLERIIARGVDQGYLRPVDPSLTIRSIVGPIMAHVLLAEVFGIVPSDGIAMSRLIDNHLTILFDGLSAPPDARQWPSS